MLERALQRRFGRVAGVFTALAGWQPEPHDAGAMGAYHVEMLGKKQTGGMLRQPMPATPSIWVVYFYVLDLAVSTARAEELGATAMMRAMPIPDVGTFSMLSDPTGALFALFEPVPGGSPC